MNIFKSEDDFYRRFKKIKKNAYKLNKYDQGSCGKDLEKLMWPKKEIKDCDMIINNKFCELKTYSHGKLTINNTKCKNYLQKAYDKIKNLYLVYYESNGNHIKYDTLYKAIGLKSFNIFKKNIKIYKSKSKDSVEVFFNPVTDVMKVFKKVKEVK